MLYFVKPNISKTLSLEYMIMERWPLRKLTLFPLRDFVTLKVPLQGGGGSWPLCRGPTVTYADCHHPGQHVPGAETHKLSG